MIVPVLTAFFVAANAFSVPNSQAPRAPRMSKCYLLKFNCRVNTFHFAWVAMAAKYKVAVLGGGPSGSNAAEALAKNKDIEVVLFERKLDNAKPCGGAIPYCMVEEFNLPLDIIDRKVTF